MHTYHLFDAHHTLSCTRFLSSTISCASLVWIMDGAMVPGGADCLVPLSEVQSGPLPCLDIATATHRFDHRVPNASNPLH